MFSQFLYPIITSNTFKETVGFFEDFLEFTPALEKENFIILKRMNWDDMYISVIDCMHPVIPEPYKTPVQGLILNYPVEDVSSFYHQLYWDGLNMVSEPESALCGRKHFFVEGPDGILIDVCENYQAAVGVDADENENIGHGITELA